MRKNTASIIKTLRKKVIAGCTAIPVTGVLIAEAVFFCPLNGLAAESTSSDIATITENEDTIRGILEWEIADNGYETLQEYLDGYCCEYPTNGNVQTYIMAICEDEFLDPDLASYAVALSGALDNSTDLYPSSYQKSVVTMCSVIDSLSDGNETVKASMKLKLLSDEVMTHALFDTIGDKGIMTYIYGLMMLDAYGCEQAGMTREAIIDALLELQLEDGGFAIYGDDSDVDVTAMTLRVLAPAYLKEGEFYADSDESSYLKLSEAVEKALSYLSGAQLSSGGFASYTSPDLPNSESTSQVILALCALDIPVLDNEILPDSASLIPALLSFGSSDGYFSHTEGAKANQMASAQAMEALVAADEELIRSVRSSSSDTVDINQENKSDSAVADKNDAKNAGFPAVISDLQTTKPINEAAEVSSSASKKFTFSSLLNDYRFYISLVLLIFAIASTIVSILLYKKEPLENKKTSGLFAFKINNPSGSSSVGTDSSPDDTDSSSEDSDFYKEKNNDKSFRKKLLRKRLVSIWLIFAILLAICLMFRISSKEAYQSSDSQVIFNASGKDTVSVTFAIDCSTVSDEVIYAPAKLNVASDSTVFEILSEVCRINDIQLDYESGTSYGLAYIKGIDSLYEFDHGDLSGWMYSVNGTFPNVGCGEYNVSDGDVIVFSYTTNLGKDLE